MMVVGWYQLLILPNVKPKMFRWSGKESHFLAYSAPIILPAFIHVMPGFLFGFQVLESASFAVVLGLMSIGSVVFLLLFPRIFLVFPAAAVNRRIGFGESWKLTKSNTFVLIKLLGLPFLVGVVVGQISGMSIILALLTIPVSLYLGVVLVAVQSLCYKVLASETESMERVD
jgi:hypothetical protein